MCKEGFLPRRSGSGDLILFFPLVVWIAVVVDTKLGELLPAFARIEDTKQMMSITSEKQ